jgi:hypothetical protein
VSGKAHILGVDLRLALVRCVTCFQPSPPPSTLGEAPTIARVAERQTRRT